MPTPSHTITCTHKALIAPNVYELRFTKPEGLTFKAGQFVLFDVPLIENPDDIQPRAFSIASSPSEQGLLFVVKLKQGGRASRFIDETLKVGDSVRIQGPFGLFTVDPKPETDYVFVATGAGIAPFRSQIVWLLKDAKHTGALHLIFGVREQQDFFWTDELQSLAAAHDNFHLHLTLSGNDEAWTGHRGRVQTVLPDVVQDVAKTHVYICGAPQMVADNKKLCLDSLLFEKKRVHAEGYI